MPVEEEETSGIEKRNVLVGIRIDGRSRELLSWALVKIAEPGDCVIALHVCRTSAHALKDKPLLDTYLGVYDGLCSVKKIGLIGKVSVGISVRKTLVKEAKNHSPVAVVVGIGNQNALGGWTSMASYCAKRLPPTTDVLAIHNGKIVLRRCNSNQLPGPGGDPRPSLYQIRSHFSKEVQSEFGDSEADTEISSIELLTRDGSGDSKDEVLSLAGENRRRSASIFTEDILDQRPGWPLLRRPTSFTAQTLEARELSVVHWAMNLPNRSSYQTPRVSTSDRMEKGDRSEILLKSKSTICSEFGELENAFEVLQKISSSSRKWFGYEVLKAATSKFHSDNLIGKGGCNRVYKGILPDGKPVAVKIRQSSEEARKEFAHEFDIISSLDHSHITPLVGVCIEDTDLISVYDFYSKGSLEENLHGKNKRALSWEVRFNIAVRIGEALNYLHNECSRPVIHRDVKSSNVLLSDGFEPKLSDFGLAIWGPTTSSFITQGDVVGTFGYIAPEYFMYGKVSDKIDVYAFGVVLLELLSGREPIASESPKDQESLVMWAKPKLDSGDALSIMDPYLEGKFDEVQVQRMVLAAQLCLTRAARLRPKMNEILELLIGKNNLEKWGSPQNKYLEDSENQDGNDDEVYPNSSAELHLSLALLDVDDYSTSLGSLDQGNIPSWEDYLKDRWSRSSSFN